MLFVIRIATPLPLRSQTSASAIQILGINRAGTNVSIHWQGGFPPYRILVNKDLNSPWTEHPNFIQTTSFTAAAELDWQFFQIRTEFAPIRLTRIRSYGDLVYLDWTGGNPPYRVQASKPSDSDWQDLPQVVLDTFYAGFVAENYSFYRIRSEPDTNAPSTPRSLSAPSVQCARAVFSWESAVDDASGSGIKAYNLYRDGLIVKQIEAPAIFVLDTGLTPRTSYEYSVSAIDRAGNESRRSSSLNVTTPACPDGETNGTASNPSLAIEWDRSEEPTTAGYIVYWGFQPGVYTWQIDVMQATTATLDGLESGVPYFIAVTAYDFSGAESEPSNRLTHIPP